MAKNDDWLETVLREDELYVDNDGFSRSVMAALPPRRASRVTRRKKIVLAAGALGFGLSLPWLLQLDPLVGTGLVDSAWFLTIALMASMGAVSMIAWWLFVVRE